MIAQMGGMPQVLIAQRLLDTIHAPLVKTPGERGRLRKFLERIGEASYGLGWRSYDYAGHRIVGHRGGVNGYRSLILFDPQLKSGVVALWNSNTSQPGGLEFEVMDMLHGLSSATGWSSTRPAPRRPSRRARRSPRWAAGTGGSAFGGLAQADPLLDAVQFGFLLPARHPAQAHAADRQGHADKQRRHLPARLLGSGPGHRADQQHADDRDEITKSAHRFLVTVS
jgi:hypothetical protein